MIFLYYKDSCYMAVTVLGDTQIVDSGSTTPIVLPVSDLPIPNVVVLDDVTLINSGTSSSSVSGGIVRIAGLAPGDVILSNGFYEYNDTIYRAITGHVYNGTFTPSYFIAQGDRLEMEVFSITNATTSVITLSTSSVGRVISVTVNGLEYIEDIDFTKGGSGNKTFTFSSNLPWETDYSPTYVKVTIIPTTY